MRKIIEYVLLGYLVIYLTSCAALIGGAAAGAGTYVWLANRLQQQADQPLNQTVEATRNALRSLNIDVTEETIGENYAQFQGRYYDNEPVWIDLYRVSPQRTQIEVRVGIPGNESASRHVMSAIQKNLGM